MSELLRAKDAEDRQRRLGTSLLDRGLGRGDRVALTLSTPEVTADGLCLVGAALRLGVIPVILGPGLVDRERAALLADADVALTIDSSTLAALVARADDRPGAELARVPLGRPMLYTSGTTGTPKGVWSGVLGARDAHALVEEERDVWGFYARDRHLVCGAFHHSAPVRFALGTLLAGGDVVLPGRFDPAGVAAAITAHRPTTTFVAPIHLQRLLDGGLTTADLSSFRLVAHAGAPCPEPLKRRAIDAFPTGTVWEFYGSTEGQLTVCSPAEWEARPGTVGRARPGRELRVDRDGIVWCRAPRWARFEYWRDPEKTAAAWADGEFTVGDLGRVDDDGYLYLDGRRDDLIITGGVNVYPAEVERVLADVPGVEDVAVFPRPDAAWGQRVCAAVSGPVDVDVLTRAAAEALAAPKRPKEIHVVHDIPRNGSGKLRRSRLARDLGLVDT